MKNKIKIGLFALIIIGVVTSCLTYNKKNEVNKTKREKQSNIAIMIKENGASDYTKSSLKDIPKGDYVLNYEKSYCKNNGKIGNYDNTLGKVSFSFVGTDSCYLYFDSTGGVDRLPVFLNTSYENNFLKSYIYDDKGIVGYQITNDFIKPDSYINYNGGNLIINLNSNTYYYIWIKDTSGQVNYYYIYTGQSKSTLKDYIVKRYNHSSSIKERTNINSIYEEDNDLLFKTDLTEDGSIIYYYAGNTQKNWVKFGKDSNNNDIYWRIIRTDIDGSIRLLYNASSPNSGNTYIAEIEFEGQAPAEPSLYSYNHSNAKKVLETWYENNLKDNYEKYINTKSTFCIPTVSYNMDGSFAPNNYFKFYDLDYNIRSEALINYQGCKDTNESFTKNTASIGLISDDEVIFAGGYLEEAGGTIKNAKVYYNVNKYSEPMILQKRWITSGLGYLLSSNEAYYLYVGGYQEHGFIRYGVQYELYGIRPVISLNNCVNFLSGDGSPEAPYIIDPDSCS